MPNEKGWERIREMLPDAIAFAIDRSGMQVAFNQEPVYHSTGRWLVEGGKRIQLGLADVGPGFDGAHTLQYAPGYTPVGTNTELAERLATAVGDRGFGDQFSPAVNATDPRDKGPDAFPNALPKQGAAQ